VAPAKRQRGAPGTRQFAQVVPQRRGGGARDGARRSAAKAATACLALAPRWSVTSLMMLYRSGRSPCRTRLRTSTVPLSLQLLRSLRRRLQRRLPPYFAHPTGSPGAQSPHFNMPQLVERVLRKTPPRAQTHQRPSGVNQPHRAAAREYFWLEVGTLAAWRPGHVLRHAAARWKGQSRRPPTGARVVSVIPGPTPAPAGPRAPCGRLKAEPRQVVGGQHTIPRIAAAWSPRGSRPVRARLSRRASGLQKAPERSSVVAK
jgi:hypothetical protein